MSTTRAWELAVGAALAVWGIHRLESGRHLLPRRYAAPLAALGLLAIVGSFVVTSANGGILLTEGENRRDALAGAFAERWSELGARGIPVLAIGNSPRSPNDLDVCAADHPRHLAACAFPKAPATVALRRQAMYLAAERVPTSSFVDFTDAICPGTTCPLVIGHVVVHRAGDHLTATYAATLGDRVIAEVNRVLDRES